MEAYYKYQIGDKVAIVINDIIIPHCEIAAISGTGIDCRYDLYVPFDRHPGEYTDPEDDWTRIEKVELRLLRKMQITDPSL